MAATVVSGAPSRAAGPAAARILRLGLGGLWLLDGLLQLQPGMWRPSVLVGEVWQPAAQGPHWLASWVAGSIRLAEPHLALFNAGLAAIELAIGAALLGGPRGAARAAAWVSLVFAAAVWVFGEGMGGLLAPGATLLSGAPGSALLYALGAAALLAPDGWRLRLGGAALQAGTAIVVATLLAGAILQLQPEFWGGVGLSAPVASNFMMPQPGPLRAAIGAAAGLAVRAPAAVNLLLMATLLSVALALVAAPADTAVLGLALALLSLLWVTAEDAGMLFSGMATDPNTMPVMAVLLISGWAGARREDGPPGGGRAP
jgi:hypothetical protein